jgi:RNA polymerase sigma-70 factor, ECF subfamily
MAKRDDVVSIHLDVSRNGQETPEEKLVRTFNELKDELISTLVFVLGNREDAKDAAQDAFIKCWNAREQLPQVLNLRAWIFRVCFNTAKDLQRSAWHRRSRPLKAEQYTMMAKDAGPGQTLERKESVERLRLAILELREEEKEVFLLRQNGDLTYEQIAEMRGCPVSTVKTQMRSALEKLRRVLNPAESLRT